MQKNSHRSRLALAAAVVAGALVLAGCTAGPDGSDGDGTVSQADIDAAMETPTKLTFWTWVGGIEAEVALFEAKYPAIDVTVENVGQGAPHYEAMRTALEAGSGLPDAVQMEYQYISSFNVTDSLLDLTPYGADALQDKFEPWVWNQVASDAGIFAVPQDAGPMGNLYRSDIYAAAGVESAPTTWDEYRDAAVAIRGVDSYISNFAPNDPGQTVGLLWSAGAKPFGYDGDKTVKVNLDSPESQAVMDYWQGMIDDDLVTTDPDFNDEWFQGFNNGKYAGWLTAAWGPLFLSSAAESTSGKWAAAALPTADGNPNTGNWGGSGVSVMEATENPIASYKLAEFINTDRESALMLAVDQFLFPTSAEILTDPAFADLESEFYGGQKVNELFTEIGKTVDVEFEWLPFMDYVYSSFTDTLGAEIASKGDLRSGLTQWQALVEQYATDQGFTVE